MKENTLATFEIKQLPKLKMDCRFHDLLTLGCSITLFVFSRIFYFNLFYIFRLNGLSRGEGEYIGIISFHDEDCKFQKLPIELKIVIVNSSISIAVVLTPF